MSQIATTREQSGRLLTAGVPRDSADMQYNAVPTRNGPSIQLFVGEATPNGLPAWSLSALWQMVYELDKTYEFPTELSADELIEMLVCTLVYRKTH